MNKITFTDITNNKNVPFSCGFPVDRELRIQIDGKNAGWCAVSFMKDPKELYLEWIEFNNEFLNSGYFRGVLFALAKNFGTETLVFESDEENLPMYEHLGGICEDFDMEREMYSFVLPIEILEKKGKESLSF